MEIKKFDEVWTADGEYIGEALALHYRPDEEINPQLKFYPVYLQVWSILLGGPCYIPTEFIGEYDAAQGHVNLMVTLAIIEHETWERAPEFVAGHLGRREELPMGQKTAVV